ncbi:MerR family transcriptional regulator [Kitasatospora sp. NPDC059599]|uniref:MerR family transcriptional regulator n=1 Tax=Kitasatospora sp. NPDC059599 TaxID=3346880 RepID=UPI0036CCC79E
MQDELITIGELAARTRLSVKALRLYDGRALLRPARTDPRTGIRRYGPEQVERARRIALLRAAGLPLARIAAVLDAGGAEGERLLLAYWREREGVHAARREAVGYARSVLTGRGEAVYEVREREVPEQRVLFVRRHVDAAALPGFLAEASGLLFDRLGRAGACLSGPLFAVYHGLVSEDSAALVEVCAPTEADLAPDGLFGVRVEPAHREAYTELSRRRGDFATMAAAHDAVAAWLAERGCERADCDREVYYPNWATAAPDEHVADVAVPLRPAG